MHVVLKSGKHIVIVRKLWGGLFILRTISMQHPLKECVMVALVDGKCRSHATAFCVIIHSRWFNSLHTSLLYIVSKLGVAKHRHLQMVLDYYRFVFYFFSYLVYIEWNECWINNNSRAFLKVDRQIVRRTYQKGGVTQMQRKWLEY